MDFSHLHKVLDDPNANITVEQCRSFLYELLDQSTRNSDECDLHDEFDAMRYYDGASTAYRLALELLSHVKNKKKPYESRALKPCPVCNSTSRQLEIYERATIGINNKRIFVLCSCGRQTIDAPSEIQARRNWNNDLVINAGKSYEDECFSLDDDLDELVDVLEEDDV